MNYEENNCKKIRKMYMKERHKKERHKNIKNYPTIIYRLIILLK